MPKKIEAISSCGPDLGGSARSRQWARSEDVASGYGANDTAPFRRRQDPGLKRSGLPLTRPSPVPQRTSNSGDKLRFGPVLSGGDHNAPDHDLGE